MKNKKRFRDLIQLLMDGATEGVSATNTLKIEGERLIHFHTPIAERYGNKIIVNITRYSLPTGQLQKQIGDMVPKDKQIIVKRVPIDYEGSLTDFLEDK